MKEVKQDLTLMATIDQYSETEILKNHRQFRFQSWVFHNVYELFLLRGPKFQEKFQPLLDFMSRKGTKPKNEGPKDIGYP